MEVLVRKNFVGRDINKNPITDWERSGAYVLGVFASAQGSAISVIKIYPDNLRWDVTDEFVTHQPDIDACLKNSQKFIKDYEIQHVFGNAMGAAVCQIKNDYSLADKKRQIKGYEVVQLEP